MDAHLVSLGKSTVVDGPGAAASPVFCPQATSDSDAPSAAKAVHEVFLDCAMSTPSCSQQLIIRSELKLARQHLTDHVRMRCPCIGLFGLLPISYVER